MYKVADCSDANRTQGQYVLEFLVRNGRTCKTLVKVVVLFVYSSFYLLSPGVLQTDILVCTDTEPREERLLSRSNDLWDHIDRSQTARVDTFVI